VRSEQARFLTQRQADSQIGVNGGDRFGDRGEWRNVVRKVACQTATDRNICLRPHRARVLERCRELLPMVPAGPMVEPSDDYRDRFEALTGKSLRTCPNCHTGISVVTDCIARPKVCLPVPDTP
jgi:hypothetical protein